MRIYRACYKGAEKMAATIVVSIILVISGVGCLMLIIREFDHPMKLEWDQFMLLAFAAVLCILVFYGLPVLLIVNIINPDAVLKFIG